MGRRPRKHVTDDLVFASMLLDAGAVLAFAEDRPQVRRWLERAETHGVDPRVALVTIAEVFRDRPAGGRVQWVLSRLDEEPFTVKHARIRSPAAGCDRQRGSDDRRHRGRNGAANARPIAVLTSDPKDLARLLEGQRQVIVATV